MTDTILWLCITVVIGVAGSVLLYRLGLPAGAMVGAIVFVGAFQILTGQGWFPKVVKTGVQALVGGFIGQRIGREDVRELRTVLRPALLLFGGIVLMIVGTGLFICRVAPVDTATAILSSMPGGMTDVALMAPDVGADPAQSTALQLVRYLIAILILPQVNVQLCRRYAPESIGCPPEKRVSARTRRNLCVTLTIAAVSGVLGKLSHFPAGAMVFPMFAVAAFNVRTGNAWLPKRLKLTAQCLAGINIGVTITLAELMTFRELLLPAAAVAVNCVMVNYLLGFLIHKTCGLDLPTSLFASVPAGMSDMALVSLEQGGDAPKVAVLQLVRYLCVMAFMPSLIKILTS